MNDLEQVDILQQELIERLLSIQQGIQNRLDRLGYNENKTAPLKKRGRPPIKQTSISDQPDTTQPVLI